MNRIFTTLLGALLLINLSFAQDTPNGSLYVLNEGAFGGLGTIGKIEYPAGTYQHIDSIEAFGNQILVHNNMLYAVDGLGDILVYDAQNNYAPVDTLTGLSARGIAFFGSQLLVASANVAPFFRALDVNNGYSEIYNLDSVDLPSSRESIQILGDYAFVSAYGFPSDSSVAVINLSGQIVQTLIETEVNPTSVIAVQGNIWVGCPDFFNNQTIIQQINPTSFQVTHTDTVGVYNGSLTHDDDEIFFDDLNGSGVVLEYDVTDMEVDTMTIDTTGFDGNVYAMTYSDEAELFFYSLTDYVTFGQVGYFDESGTSPALSTYISPRRMFFVQSTAASVDPIASVSSISLYPNPAQDFLQIKREDASAAAALTIYDLQGKMLLQTAFEAGAETMTVPVQHFPAGMYQVQVVNGQNSWTGKIIKR
ncbi:T9SS type A sorting domain-containing protein [Pontibacter sp. G13]|uniref:T9SS type A sorting domain-containing protein n=1 Tax=Pontibacter sp. G13 TaxID=3074898 RepID=UPI00288AB323|nr:T9SS type A sorting domain-containing protein [Pontibacter sp. G13]WNJ19499.1 T9SS type A sorting domain-containing protein [Pontibacter sp. G13]